MTIQPQQQTTDVPEKSLRPWDNIDLSRIVGRVPVDRRAVDAARLRKDRITAQAQKLAQR